MTINKLQQTKTTSECYRWYRDKDMGWYIVCQNVKERVIDCWTIVGGALYPTIGTHVMSFLVPLCKQHHYSTICVT